MISLSLSLATIYVHARIDRSRENKRRTRTHASLSRRLSSLTAYDSSAAWIPGAQQIQSPQTNTQNVMISPANSSAGPVAQGLTPRTVTVPYQFSSKELVDWLKSQEMDM